MSPLIFQFVLVVLWILSIWSLSAAQREGIRKLPTDVRVVVQRDTLLELIVGRRPLIKWLIGLSLYSAALTAAEVSLAVEFGGAAVYAVYSTAHQVQSSLAVTTQWWQERGMPRPSVPGYVRLWTRVSMGLSNLALCGLGVLLGRALALAF